VAPIPGALSFALCFLKARVLMRNVGDFESGDTRSTQSHLLNERL
jgi:hypothetical protein